MNQPIGGGAARNDPYENPIHPGRAGAEAIGERGGGGGEELTCFRVLASEKAMEMSQGGLNAPTM